MQPVNKVKHREIDNQRTGRSGAGTMKKSGPAKGRRGVVNPTKGGGIYRPTKGRS
jgi:hypothetical protein